MSSRSTASRSDVDFRYRIFNSDGGEVEQCGNGARCFVHFVRDQGLTDKSAIRVETLSGIIEPRLDESGEVTVDMGTPAFDVACVPFEASGLEPRREHDDLLWPLDVDGRPAGWGAFNGNPPPAGRRQVDRAVADGVRRSNCMHGFRSGERGYAQVVDHHRIGCVLRRGAGETLACGTGACAAAVAEPPRAPGVASECFRTRRYADGRVCGPVWIGGRQKRFRR
jgi:diaminopimelate epimerase